MYKGKITMTVLRPRKGPGSSWVSRTRALICITMREIYANLISSPGMEWIQRQDLGQYGWGQCPVESRISQPISPFYTWENTKACGLSNSNHITGVFFHLLIFLPKARRYCCRGVFSDDFHPGEDTQAGNNMATKEARKALFGKRPRVSIYRLQIRVLLWVGLLSWDRWIRVKIIQQISKIHQLSRVCGGWHANRA